MKKGEERLRIYDLFGVNKVKAYQILEEIMRQVINSKDMEELARALKLEETGEAGYKGYMFRGLVGINEGDEE